MNDSNAHGMQGLPILTKSALVQAAQTLDLPQSTEFSHQIDPGADTRSAASDLPNNSYASPVERRVANQIPRPSKYRRFLKQAGITLPKYMGPFEEFAFKNGYKNFVLEVQVLNNNRAPRATVENAWKSIIHKKYHLWKPEMEQHLKVRSKNLALKQVKDSRAWSKADIEAYWQGIIAWTRTTSSSSNNPDESTHLQGAAEEKGLDKLEGKDLENTLKWPEMKGLPILSRSAQEVKSPHNIVSKPTTHDAAIQGGGRKGRKASGQVGGDADMDVDMF